MTTNKQTDYFKKYRNVEVISSTGPSGLGQCRVVGQLKNGGWALWEASQLWGGNFSRPRRMRDLSGSVLSFPSKEEAIEYSGRIK